MNDWGCPTIVRKDSGTEAVEATGGIDREAPPAISVGTVAVALLDMAGSEIDIVASENPGVVPVATASAISGMIDPGARSEGSIADAVDEAAANDRDTFPAVIDGVTIDAVADAIGRDRETAPAVSVGVIAEALAAAGLTSIWPGPSRDGVTAVAFATAGWTSSQAPSMSSIQSWAPWAGLEVYVTFVPPFVPVGNSWPM